MVTTKVFNLTPVGKGKDYLKVLEISQTTPSCVIGRNEDTFSKPSTKHAGFLSRNHMRLMLKETHQMVVVPLCNPSSHISINGAPCESSDAHVLKDGDTICMLHKLKVFNYLVEYKTVNKYFKRPVVAAPPATPTAGPRGSNSRSNSTPLAVPAGSRRPSTEEAAVASSSSKVGRSLMSSSRGTTGTEGLKRGGLGATVVKGSRSGLYKSSASTSTGEIKAECSALLDAAEHEARAISSSSSSSLPSSSSVSSSLAPAGGSGSSNAKGGRGGGGGVVVRDKYLTVFVFYRSRSERLRRDHRIVSRLLHLCDRVDDIISILSTLPTLLENDSPVPDANTSTAAASSVNTSVAATTQYASLFDTPTSLKLQLVPSLCQIISTFKSPAVNEAVEQLAARTLSTMLPRDIRAVLNLIEALSKTVKYDRCTNCQDTVASITTLLFNTVLDHFSHVNQLASKVQRKEQRRKQLSPARPHFRASSAAAAADSSSDEEEEEDTEPRNRKDDFLRDEANRSLVDILAESAAGDTAGSGYNGDTASASVAASITAPCIDYDSHIISRFDFGLLLQFTTVLYRCGHYFGCASAEAYWRSMLAAVGASVSLSTLNKLFSSIILLQKKESLRAVNSATSTSASANRKDVPVAAEVVNPEHPIIKSDTTDNVVVGDRSFVASVNATLPAEHVALFLTLLLHQCEHVYRYSRALTRQKVSEMKVKDDYNSYTSNSHSSSSSSSDRKTSDTKYREGMEEVENIEAIVRSVELMIEYIPYNESDPHSMLRNFLSVICDEGALVVVVATGEEGEREEEEEEDKDCDNGGTGIRLQQDMNVDDMVKHMWSNNNKRNKNNNNNNSNNASRDCVLQRLLMSDTVCKLISAGSSAFNRCCAIRLVSLGQQQQQQRYLQQLALKRTTEASTTTQPGTGDRSSSPSPSSYSLSSASPSSSLFDVLPPPVFSWCMPLAFVPHFPELQEFLVSDEETTVLSGMFNDVDHARLFVRVYCTPGMGVQSASPSSSSSSPLLMLPPPPPPSMFQPRAAPSPRGYSSVAASNSNTITTAAAPPHPHPLPPPRSMSSHSHSIDSGSAPSSPSTRAVNGATRSNSSSLHALGVLSSSYEKHKTTTREAVNIDDVALIDHRSKEVLAKTTPVGGYPSVCHYSVIATVAGSGRRTHVHVRKTKQYFNCQVNAHREVVAEKSRIQTLLSIGQCNICSDAGQAMHVAAAAKEEAAATATVRQSSQSQAPYYNYKM